MPLYKSPLEHNFPELANIYLSQDINSVSELYGQRVYSFAHNSHSQATSEELSDIAIKLQQ
jgi:hypothetical protein